MNKCSYLAIFISAIYLVPSLYKQSEFEFAQSTLPKSRTRRCTTRLKRTHSVVQATQLAKLGNQLSPISTLT